VTLASGRLQVLVAGVSMPVQQIGASQIQFTAEPILQWYTGAGDDRVDGSSSGPLPSWPTKSAASQLR
jgi:hypothetical protein